MTDIEKLRAAYCDHFIKTGELDQRMLAELTAYAKSKRGAPKPDRRRNENRPVIMPSLRGRGRGRIEGSKMVVVNGVRRMMSPAQMERMKHETFAPQDKTDAPAIG